MAGVVVLVAGAQLTTRAQTTPPTSGPTSGPISRAQDGTISEAQAASVREKRARAYAKLLEGQRYLSYVRSGNPSTPPETAIRLARQAFLDATQLDPTLAEAYTALAEMAVTFSPRSMDEAIRLATEAIKIDRDNLGAHQWLGRVYGLRSGLGNDNLDRGAAELAIGEYRQVARISPNDAEAWALLGELYVALGKTDEAISALSKWAALPMYTDPRFFQAITGGREIAPDAAAARLGEVLLAAGRANEATVAIRRALALDPKNRTYEALLERAIDAGGGADEATITGLRGMVAADPSNPTPTILLSRVYARTGRVEDAIAALRSGLARLAAADKDSALRIRLALAQIYADAMRYDDARAIFEAMLSERGIANARVTSEADKRIASELFRRILELRKIAGQTKEALAVIARMRVVIGDDPRTELLNVELLRDIGRRQEALKAAQDARALYPGQDDFLYLEATTLTDLGKVEDGVALMRARLSTGAASADASMKLQDLELYLRMSALYTQAKRGAQAVEAAQAALKLVPSDRPDLVTACLITLASAQDRAGDPKGSEESLRRVLAKDPDNATALNNLGYFLVERDERLEEALGMIQIAVRSEPTNSSFLDSLGWAYYKLAKLEEAERYLSEAARRSPTSATIQEHLGDVYNRLGKTAPSRVAWQRALALTVEPDAIARIKAKLEDRAAK